MEEGNSLAQSLRICPESGITEPWKKRQRTICQFLPVSHLSLVNVHSKCGKLPHTVGLCYLALPGKCEGSQRVPRQGIASTQAWSSLLVSWPPSRGSSISSSGSIGSRHRQEGHEPWLGFSSLEINQSNSNFGRGGGGGGGDAKPSKSVWFINWGKESPPKLLPVSATAQQVLRASKGKNKQILLNYLQFYFSILWFTDFIVYFQSFNSKP